MGNFYKCFKKKSAMKHYIHIIMNTIRIYQLHIIMNNMCNFLKIISSACSPAHMPPRATHCSMLLALSTALQLYCELSILNIIYCYIIMVNEDFGSLQTHRAHPDITSFSLPLIPAIGFYQLGVTIFMVVTVRQQLTAFIYSLDSFSLSKIHSCLISSSVWLLLISTELLTHTPKRGSSSVFPPIRI